MTPGVVYFNGRFVDPSAARVSIYDSALVMGDMAYEVTRTFQQRPFRLEDHIARLWHTLGVLQINPGLSPAELLAATLDTLARNQALAPDVIDWNVIHNVSRGPAAAYRAAFAPEERRPTVIVSCFPLDERLVALAPQYETGIDLIVPEQRTMAADWLDASIKTRSRWHFQRASQQATERRAGAWAALVDPAGNLTESTAANLFFVRAGRLLTPPVRRVLPGITRGVVLDEARRLGIPAEEVDLRVEDVAACEEVFVTGTSIGVLHARSFDEQPVGDGRRGPITARLAAALDQAVGLSFAEQARACAARATNAMA